MFNWSLLAHPTYSYPFKMPHFYKSIHPLHYPTAILHPIFCSPCLHLCYPNIDSKYNEEAYDSFYMEIEKRIMLVISDEEDEEPTVKNKAPPLTISGKKPQFFAMSNSFLDVNWYGSFDLRMKQRQIYFGSGNSEKSAWEIYETRRKARERRASWANERKGTGVFIPRSA